MSKINHQFLTSVDITTGPILASTSTYRRKLLDRLGINFDVANPEVDETPFNNEAPRALVQRLADAKATSVARIFPQRVVIGSDQIALADGQILGKPGNATAAKAQLHSFSGRPVEFLTALTISARGGRSRWSHLDTTTVFFRELNEDDINNYIQKEPSFDCAGGFKCEALGISLFNKIESEDPSALIGLPLIAVGNGLRHFGFTLP